MVRIDKIDGFANLELWDDPGHVLWDIPFGAIHLIREGVSETVTKLAG